MEEVKGSNPFRSTKTFQTLSSPIPRINLFTGVQTESKASFFAWAASGQLANCLPAHDLIIQFNELIILGSVGTVIHACCLLETTTTAFHIRTLPIVVRWRALIIKTPLNWTRHLRILTILRIQLFCGF
jgi:hypothetical protein